MTDPMMVDFHTHILPGVDDGSSSVECSCQMLRMLGEQGVTHVVATPHFYPSFDHPDRFLQRRQVALELLQKAMEPGFPEILVGAEVYFFEGISECDVLQELVICGTDHIMVEMPGTLWTERMLRELAELKNRHGLTPIIAHVDRYMGPICSHGIPQMLENLPVKVQLNTGAVLSRTKRRMALGLLREGRVHVLGTDCHNLVTRKPDMEQALRVVTRHLGSDTVEQLRQNGQKILQAKGKS